MIAGNGTKMKDRWNIVGCVLFCFVVFGVQAQQQHPVNKKAWGLFQQARESFREGDKEKALGLLLKAETFDQGFSPLYLLKADIYNKKGDKIQEIRAIETALALDSLKVILIIILFWPNIISMKPITEKLWHITGGI
ncbi:MAG: tetratricopeptide repeat protein [Odoribacter splanchnicus]